MTASNSLVLGGTGANAVNVGIGVTAPQAELEVNGFTMLGSNAPKIKMLKLTGTTAATQGGFISIPHGLVGTKIIGVDVHVEYAPANFVPDGYAQSTGNQFTYNYNTTNITILNSPANSANILSKPVRILITYEE